MARTFTLSELVSLAKQYADMVGESFVSDAEWRGYISSAYAQLHSVLVSSGMRYFEGEYEITTDGGAYYALPSDLLSVIGVDYLVDGTSTGRREQLREMMVQERNRFTGVNGSGPATRWYLAGDNLYLAPTPPSSQQYALLYVTQPAKLATDGSDDSETIDVVTPDGEQFLIWYAVFMARDKEESDVRSALRERESALERVREWAALRAFNSPREPMVREEFMENEGDPADWWWARGGY